MSLRGLRELAIQPYELSPVCDYTSSRPPTSASKTLRLHAPSFRQILTWSWKQLPGHKQLCRLRFGIHFNQSFISCVVTAGLHKLSGYHRTNIPTFTGTCATTPGVRVQSLCWWACALSVCHHAVVRPAGLPNARLSKAHMCLTGTKGQSRVCSRPHQDRPSLQQFTPAIATITQRTAALT